MQMMEGFARTQVLFGAHAFHPHGFMAVVFFGALHPGVWH